MWRNDFLLKDNKATPPNSTSPSESVGAIFIQTTTVPTSQGG